MDITDERDPEQDLRSAVEQKFRYLLARKLPVDFIKDDPALKECFAREGVVVPEVYPPVKPLRDFLDNTSDEAKQLFIDVLSGNYRKPLTEEE